MEKTKKSLSAILLAMSFIFIYLAIEGSFTVLSIAVPILLYVLYFFCIKKYKKISIDKSSLMLILLFLTFLFSTVINIFLHIDVISFSIITGLIYFGIIFFWKIIVTQCDYSKQEIKFIINIYILISIIASLDVIFRNYTGSTGKLSIITLFGIKINANYFAAFIAIPPLLNFNYIIYSKKETILKKAFRVIGLIINIYGLFLTGSRAALIGYLGAQIVAIIIYTYRKITMKKIVLSIVFVGVALMFLGNISKYIPSWMYNRYFVNSYSDRSNEERVLIWRNAIDGVTYKPLLGYGIGIFNKLDKYTALPNGWTLPDSAPAHNTYLDILIYGGIVGIILFITFIVIVVKPFLKKDNIIYIPIILNLLFTSIIIGADKAVYFWNNLIIMNIIIKYICLDNNNTIYDVFE